MTVQRRSDNSIAVVTRRDVDAQAHPIDFSQDRRAHDADQHTHSPRAVVPPAH